jgi:phenylacetate-CoA ligase
MDTTQTLRQRIFEMLMESQYWPPEQMLAYQRSQLAQLLRHAKATVPFYKTRLDAVFKTNGEIDWDRWHEIPIVTRTDLRDRRDEMLTTSLPPGHGPTKTFHSSGSSGVPVSVEVTQLGSSSNRAATMRQLAYHEIKSKKTRATLVHLNEEGGFIEEEFYFRDRQKADGGALHQASDIAINRGLPDRRKLQLLKQLAVCYLLENPNNAELLARANLEFGEGVKLDTIFCTGQELTLDQKDLFNRSFGARGNIVYSSKEGGAMGFECGNGPNFHVNSELVLLEVATPEGNPCEIDQVGRVIITPFFSTALPLIRYDQGDTAKLLPPCNCKCKLPLMGQIGGRQDQRFLLPDGEKSITGGIGSSFICASLNALAFQLAQTAALKMEVRYIPAHANTQIATAQLIEHFQKLIHPDLEVIFKMVDKIPLNAGGKQQRFVREFP